MSEPLKLRRLEHLVLLAEQLNFARAAELACLSQSAFSRSIQALEDSLGLRLFDRGLRYVRLTSAGVRLVSRARKLLSSTTDLQRELELLRRGDLGDVAVGAGPFTAVAIFPAALARLYALHPEINIRLAVDHSSALLQQLDEEKLDFFISDIREISLTEDILVQPLGTLKGSLFCRTGHPMLDRAPLDVADLVNLKFASVHMPAVVRQELSKLVGQRGHDGFSLAFECESAVVARELISRTDVVLVACREALLVEIEHGLVQELKVTAFDMPGSLTPLRTEIGVVRHRERTPTPASELLLEYALDVAAQCLT